MREYTIRPLSLGELLDVSFGLYRQLFLPLLAVALATRGPPLAVDAYIRAAGGFPAQPLLWFGNAILSAVLGAIGIAATTFIVSDGYLGQRLAAGAAFGRATPFAGRIIMLSILGTLVVGCGLVLLIVPGVILACGLAVAASALVLESQPTATAAMSRSWALTKGLRGKVFGTLLVTSLLLSLPSMALGGMAVAGAVVAGGGETAVGYAVTTVVGILSLLISPFFYVALTVLYYDLRVRKEAFDLEMLSAQLQRG